MCLFSFSEDVTYWIKTPSLMTRQTALRRANFISRQPFEIFLPDAQPKLIQWEKYQCT